MPDGGAAAADMKRAPRAPGRANLPLLPLGPGGVQSGAAARGTKFKSNQRLAAGTTGPGSEPQPTVWWDRVGRHRLQGPMTGHSIATTFSTQISRRGPRPWATTVSEHKEAS